MVLDHRSAANPLTWIKSLAVNLTRLDRLLLHVQLMLGHNSYLLNPRIKYRLKLVQPMGKVHKTLGLILWHDVGTGKYVGAYVTHDPPH